MKCMRRKIRDMWYTVRCKPSASVELDVRILKPLLTARRLICLKCGQVIREDRQAQGLNPWVGWMDFKVCLAVAAVCCLFGCGCILTIEYHRVESFFIVADSGNWHRLGSWKSVALGLAIKLFIGSIYLTLKLNTIQHEISRCIAHFGAMKDHLCWRK